MSFVSGVKVVRASEMAKAEAFAYEEGASEESFMQVAGEQVAKRTAEWMQHHGVSKQVTLLAGKGNNAADAFVAGCVLLSKGYSVRALSLFPLDDCSPLCQVHASHFQNQGGEIEKVDDFDNLFFGIEGVLLDGLLGTGFKGSVKDPILSMIRAANQSKIPIISIDIPSGVHGDTGLVDPEAIQAQRTIALGQPKAGCFIGDGYRYAKDVVVESFGLAPKYVHKMDTFAYLVEKDALFEHLPPLHRDRHKYEAGYVVGVSGSKGMGGAAKLASMAALRSGAGIVRLFYGPNMEEEMQSAPMELIRCQWDLENIDDILRECERAKVVFIGPGIGRSSTVNELLAKILPEIKVPCVLDADALFFIAQHLDVQLPRSAIFTPHHGEMLRLLQMKQKDKRFLDRCRQYADEKQVVLVLKGAPTFIFRPGADPFIIAHGDPGMATAGTGDVLTGIISAFVAQGLAIDTAAVMGVYLHALSGEIAAKKKSSYSLIASDLIDFLSDSFLTLKKANGR